MLLANSTPATTKGYCTRSLYRWLTHLCKWHLLAIVLCAGAFGQNWSTFLDTSRAIDWHADGAGFTIPNYTVACSGSPPSLTAGSVNAAANSTAIQNALATCDSTHNVVNLPQGTYFVNGITFTNSGHQVLRGAGANCNGCTTGGTDLVFATTASAGCSGLPTGICMMNSGFSTFGAATTPPSGNRQCAWTTGYSQGTTSITLNTCPGTLPSVGQFIILDQANDLTDNGGIFLCDSFTSSQAGGNPHCSGNDGVPSNSDGRQFGSGGPTYSQKQLTVITSVSGSGTGPYTVGISPGVYFTNVASANVPGAWWVGAQVVNDGIENLTLDNTNLNNSTVVSAIQMAGCYQCWVKGIRSIDSVRAHVFTFYSAFDVIRDSYFYQSQAHAEQSYAVEIESSSGILVENNIFQQVTNPIMHGNGSGDVIDYNFSVDNIFSGNYLQFSDYDHNAGSEMNLWEGNNFQTIWGDEEWGSSHQGTIFRNFDAGWQTGKLYSTVPFALRAYLRAFNVVGNVFGQPGYHTTYESYATSTSGGVNQSLTSLSIYSLGWTGVAETTAGTCTSPPVCDPLPRSTLMRWGNYDTVNAANQWNSTEASPGAVAFVNANFTTSYFNTLSHTLPASLFYTSGATTGCGTGLSFWKNPTLGTCPPFPPVGPDITSGDVGTCTGTFLGAQATTAGQCTGGTLSTAWAGHANANPAQVCFLSVMSGPPDGTGSVLNFDPTTCYASDPVSAPTTSIPALTLRLQ